MIAQLTGTVTHKGLQGIILDVRGVGYKLSLPKAVLSEIKEREEVFLWTHLEVRENALELYGFSAKEEVDFFELLISVSGIGPKSALAVMNLAPISTLVNAIRSGDANYLTKVSGIGKKTAGKIILELKDKLGEHGTEEHPIILKEEIDALEALRTLGYSAESARGVLQEIGNTARGTQEKIKAALKMLSER